MIKELAIKWGLYVETNVVKLDRKLYEEAVAFETEASKHFCKPCKRWFSDTRGKLMHDRHRHTE